MSQELAILIVLFAALLCLRVPIAFVLGMVTVVTAVALDYDNIPLSAASDLSNGIDSFSLLAIPFFILAGELMGSGGLARRLIDLATAIVGRLPGGLAAVNTVTCMLFGAISGSSVAAVSSIGGTLIPEMNRKGYDRDFNIAVTASAATTGLLIPPSNIMIVYALVAGNVSVAALFMAGILPGVLVGLGIMIVALVICVKRGYGKQGESVLESYPSLFSSMWRAFPALLLVFIVLGGILSGTFTATEASAIAVLWAFILGVICYREIKFAELSGIILRAARTTAVVLFLVACSYAMSRLLTQEQVPQQVSEGLLSLSQNPIVILLIMNLILLMVGVFMDMTPAVLIFTPIFLPIAITLGIDPTHFGIILIANLCIGLLTPPVGTCLFVGAGVGKSDIMSVSKAMLPFYVVMVLALLVITYWSPLSMTLPRMLGL
jgi:tripartite ATP-independent transporter DctM subunit